MSALFQFFLFLHQLICHIIPFSVGVFQKFRKIRLIMNH